MIWIRNWINVQRCWRVQYLFEEQNYFSAHYTYPSFRYADLSKHPCVSDCIVLLSMLFDDTIIASEDQSGLFGLRGIRKPVRIHRDLCVGCFCTISLGILFRCVLPFGNRWLPRWRRMQWTVSLFIKSDLFFSGITSPSLYTDACRQKLVVASERIEQKKTSSSKFFDIMCVGIKESLIILILPFHLSFC